MPDGASAIDSVVIDPEVIATRIGALLSRRRPGAVKPLIAALARLSPGHKKLGALRAAYWCQMQDFPAALATLDSALVEQPEDAGLWLYKAEIFFTQGRYDEAAQNAAQALLLAPDMDAAKSRLGLTLMQLGQFDQALPCLAESFAAHPGNPEIALALAVLSPASAIDLLQQAAVASPKLVVLRNALTRRYLSGDETKQAMRMARQAIGEGIADAQTHCLLAFAQMQEASWDEAGFSTARALSMAPGNPWATRLNAALASRKSGRVIPSPPDNAEAAEQALIAGGIIAPGAFRALIEESEISGPVLDVFCGSGLNPVAAQGLSVGPWFGVDPSWALLTRSAEQGYYAALAHHDPLQVFAVAPEIPIILLNEALAYCEAPKSFLGTVRARLATGGIALAAIPTGRPGLCGHGLFTHPEAAIAQYAAGAGLSFEVARSGILRHLEGLPIHGIIAIFRPI